MLDVLIGQDTSTDEDVLLRYEDRPLGVAIIGKSGTGKSSILEHLILSDLASGTPGVVIDPHGRLAERVIRCATPEQAGRIVLLEASQTNPFGLNLLAVRDPINEDDDPVSWAADSVVAAIKKLYGQDDDYLPRLEHYLDLAVRTLIPNGGTLRDAPRLFRNQAYRQACLRRVSDQAVVEDWEVYDSLRKTDQVTHIEAVINRLSRLLRPPIIQSILGSLKTTLPFEDVLSGDKMLIVSLPSERLSPERCDFIGSLILYGFADRIFARSLSGQPPRVHIYVDEYQRFASSTTAQFLEEGRKFQVGLTLAHQTLYQITDMRIRNAARHAGSLIVLGVTRPDADALAGEFPIRPREEWTETVVEQDGLELETILSLDPLGDVLRRGHSNPAVHEAAVMLSSSVVRHDTYLPHPAYDAINNAFLSDFRLTSKATATSTPQDVDISELLMEAMSGKEHTAVDILEYLWERGESKAETVEESELWSDKCAEWIDVPSESARHPSPEPPRMNRRGRWLVPDLRDLGPSFAPVHFRIRDPREYSFDRRYCGYQDVHIAAYTNQQLDALKQRDCATFYFEYRTWFDAHIANLASFVTGDYIEAFKRADEKLVKYAYSHRWSAGSFRRQLYWHGQDPVVDDADARQQIQQQLYEYVAVVREQYQYLLRWLSILCAGLQKERIEVTTSNQRRRMRTHHLVHPRQPEQDALNEFARNLVDPPERYVAHARLPTRYHQVKLLPPVDGEGEAGRVPQAPVDPLGQLHDVRRRSQAMYQQPRRTENEPPPPRKEKGQGRPPIGRRPRASEKSVDDEDRTGAEENLDDTD